MKLFFQSTQLSGCAEWGGEGDVDQGVFARAYLEDHQSRAELGPMPAWVVRVRMVTGNALGSGWDRERVYT